MWCVPLLLTEAELVYTDSSLVWHIWSLVPHAILSVGAALDHPSMSLACLQFREWHGMRKMRCQCHDVMNDINDMCTQFWVAALHEGIPHPRQRMWPHGHLIVSTKHDFQAISKNFKTPRGNYHLWILGFKVVQHNQSGTAQSKWYSIDKHPL